MAKPVSGWYGPRRIFHSLSPSCCGSSAYRIITLQTSAGTLLLPHAPGKGPGWAVAAACLAAYVLLAWISFIHVHKGLPVPPWDPGLGVVFALMVFAGPQAGIVLFGGVVIAETFVLHNEVEWAGHDRRRGDHLAELCSGHDRSAPDLSCRYRAVPSV
jgi:hypothetical protein